MNIILITIAVILIIICIYLVISYTNNNFRNMITSLKTSASQTAESFTGHPEENCGNDSIGIIFHKFHMNSRYNVESLDEVYLSDYCSEEYLERNFVNIINDLWDQVGFNFYLKEIVKENEVENLMKYYLYTPEEYIKYPSCQDQTRYLQQINNNERQQPNFSRSASEPSCAKFTRVIFEDTNQPSELPANFKKIFRKATELDGNGYVQYENTDGITLTFNTTNNKWQTSTTLNRRTNLQFYLISSVSDPQSKCPTPDLTWTIMVLRINVDSNGNRVFDAAGNVVFEDSPEDSNIKIKFDLDSLYPEPQAPDNSLVYPYLPDDPNTTPNGHGIPKINDARKKKFSQLDVFIIKEYLSHPNLLGDVNDKKVLAAIFTRMTDESLYQTKYSRDLHIYLLPYIEADNVIILEGRDKKPLILMSMFYKDCNRMKRVLENFNNDKLCGNWLTSLMSSFNSLKKLEESYNKFSKFNLTQDPDKHCKAKVMDKDSEENKEYSKSVERLIDQEREIINKISDLKKSKIKDVNMWKRCIETNTKKMQDIYEYNYFNDHRVKVLKQFKGRTGPFNDPNVPYPTEVITNYQTMVKLTVKKIKQEQEGELQRLKADTRQKEQLLNEYENKLKFHEDDLVNKQKDIGKKLEYKTHDIEKLKVLKKMIDQKKKEINLPMVFAEKAKPIININLVITSLFHQINLPSGVRKTKDLYKELEVCQILAKRFDKGGLIINIDLRKLLLQSRKNLTFLEYDTAKASGRSLLTYIDAPSIPTDATNTNFLDIDNREDTLGNKCNLDILSTKTYININEDYQMKFADDTCQESQNYEVLHLNNLDRDAQYYLINQLVNEISPSRDLSDHMNSEAESRLKKIHEELTDKCLDQEIDLRNKRAEPEYVRGKSATNPNFFMDSEAIENYKWLLNYYRKNKPRSNIQHQNRAHNQNINRIITDIEHLLNTQNPNKTMEDSDIKNTIFPPDNFEYDYDAIPCPDLQQFETDYSAFFGTDVTHPSLNSFVLDKQSCNNNYLDSFKDSFI